MAKRPNITVQVLPFSARLHHSMSGGFVVLDFPPGVPASQAYFEYAVSGDLEVNPAIVRSISEVHEQLSADSLSADDSTAFLAEWI